MKILKSIMVEKAETVAIVCNKCGTQFDCEKDLAANLIHGFHIQFCYGSKHDLEEWYFDLCEKCIDKLTGSFKIKPTKLEIGPFGEQYGRELK